MTKLNGRLITYITTDGFHQKGYLAVGEANRSTIIHIHGNFGNFYENNFIPIMAEQYTTAGINFLSVNNRGHDGIAEVYQNGQLTYTGGAIESPEECIYDISGAVEYAQQLGAPIILQGHSFGCLRTLVYLLRVKEMFNFILLSPADSFGLQSKYIYPEKIPDQIKRIRDTYADRMDMILPKKEFGIRCNGVEYNIPVSAHTFTTLFSGYMTNILRYDEPLSFNLKSNGFVYYGGKDALWTATRNSVEDFFYKRVSNLYFCYCEEGDHHFHDIESYIVNEIIDWIYKL